MCQRIGVVRYRVDDACESCNRDLTTVTVLAVTKQLSVEAVGEAIDCGLTVFGENRLIDAFFQLNLTQEPQKSSIFAESLDKTLRLGGQYSNVRFRGLMTIGRHSLDPGENRLDFRQLAELGREVDAEWLSLGLSNDLEVAI